MSIAEAPLPAGLDRRNRILDAAERCFVRNGFHRSTMQDVAAECGMSPGNLYRYFESKDALVAGLAGRDRERMQADFATLSVSDDPLKTFVRLGRRHLVEEPRTKSILMQEIWAEASRNPQVAALCATMDEAICGSLTGFVAHWRERFHARGTGEPEEVARLIIALADGLCRRRATDPEFDAPKAYALALPIIFHMLGASTDLIAEVSQ